MSDSVRSARVAAISMANGAALAKLLRAHGRTDHADAIDAALSEVAAIVSTEVGRRTLSEAMSWVSDQVWNCDELAPTSSARH
ncbi:MAG TPA: hypothetical protein VMQ73_13805 [Methylomirabilota bacterium]|nr:hypothetical protein [Methylomirabilota bacterium]